PLRGADDGRGQRRQAGAVAGGGGRDGGQIGDGGVVLWFAVAIEGLRLTDPTGVGVLVRHGLAQRVDHGSGAFAVVGQRIAVHPTEVRGAGQGEGIAGSARVAGAGLDLGVSAELAVAAVLGLDELVVVVVPRGLTQIAIGG